MAQLTDTARPLRGWFGVAATAAATFTVVTSEMLPVGLLTPIGSALRVTEGVAGLTLTITGLVAAVSAPLLTPLLGRLDRRLALAALMVVLALGNLLAAWSPGFGVMVAGRVLVGVGMGGVWAIAAGLGARLVPGRPSATALIFSGIAVASVLGVPLGTYLGELADWRTVFLVAAVLALAVAVALVVLLPPLPAEPGLRLSGVLRLVGDPRAGTGLAVVALLVTGHFAAYTYVRPVLAEVSGVDSGLGALLLGYGIAGVAGNFAAGWAAARSPRATLAGLGVVLAAAVLLIPLLGGGIVLMVVWGLAYGGVSVGTQTWLLASVPHAREAGSALFVGVFNAAIAAGALVGGRVADGLGVTAVMWAGGALAVAAAVVAGLGRAPASGRL
ncbi:MFS transporter [Amycolatopsis albispora]|uniref:Transporter n=1 Tax=Amycolatopsis albispora TaxID=1804986 RepID=A0A344L2R1_9PSEU|nr:MFS transporter [Amycolatopsis albispora]AXB42335.1 transporter [Amycolatopsis albispora]